MDGRTDVIWMIGCLIDGLTGLDRLNAWLIVWAAHCSLFFSLSFFPFFLFFSFLFSSVLCVFPSFLHFKIQNLRLLFCLYVYKFSNNSYQNEKKKNVKRNISFVFHLVRGLVVDWVEFRLLLVCSCVFVCLLVCCWVVVADVLVFVVFYSLCIILL